MITEARRFHPGLAEEVILKRAQPTRSALRGLDGARPNSEAFRRRDLTDRDPRPRQQCELDT